MRQSGTPHLSKSRFTAGIQCPKRLYLACFDSKLADPVTPDMQARFDSGSRVGEIARQRYPGGRLITEAYYHHGRAEETTRRAMREPAIPALYEAAFTYDGIRIRADVLHRIGTDQYDLVEVKSSTRAKDDHLYDVAVQLYVLRGLGITIRRAGLLHLNKEYVHPGGEYDLEQLFHFADLTDDVNELLLPVQDHLESMREMLNSPSPPDINTGPHCTAPYQCPFYGHCHAGGPDHPVSELYRASATLMERLREAGIRDIRHIPDSFNGLTQVQARTRESLIENRPVVGGELAGVLRSLPRPVHFIDFETFNPALPRYPGTHPYEVIPFQWSDHVLEEDGTVQHHDFLADSDQDPRSSFARTLLQAASDAGSIVTYSNYEDTQLRALAEHFTQFAPDLHALRERITDLLPLVRANCYHPKFHGSFSLKNVLPAFVPESGYDDLDIQGGSVAAIRFEEMIHPDTTPARAVEIRSQLLAYCERDTEAMLRLFEKFVG